MQEYITQIIAGALGSLGYSILFNIRRDKLGFCVLGSALSWLMYILFSQIIDSLFLVNMLASACATLYAEILARIKKAPTTIFLIPSVMPMIPGGSLYYTMSAAILENRDMVTHYLLNTIQIASGISIGIMLMSLIGVRLLKAGIITKRR